MISRMLNSRVTVLRRLSSRTPITQFANSNCNGITMALRVFSSSSSSSHGGERLGRTLYRQLLRWSHDADDEIPLSNVVPPVTLQPPHAVSPESLKELARSAGGDRKAEETLQDTTTLDPEFARILTMLPPRSQVESHRLLVPIHRASHVGQLLRAVFRMNQLDKEIDKATFQQRTSIAFEALKSLNELTQALVDMKVQREKHLDREGVSFLIGQVVQHKTERWRGVVAGWQRIEPSSNRTSLTMKSYERDENLSGDPLESLDQGDSEEQDLIQYTIVLDSGDATMLGGRRQQHNSSGMPVAMQTDLELVKDDGLLRIRSNWIQQHFDRFDPVQKCFIPNKSRGYEYPIDTVALEEVDPSDTVSLRRNELGQGVIEGIQAFAAGLTRCIYEESRGYPLLVKIHSRLDALAKGDVLTQRDLLSSEERSSFDLAVLHLRALLNVSSELSEILWSRRIAEENRDGIRFSLGEIVQHTKYGFRGVVVAWDPTPTVDVSHWDGLVDIENASELPFYHVIPDSNDCVEAFGAARPFRYVCEANLEQCPRKRTILNVDLDPEWVYNSAEARYTPPDDLKFKYAEHIEDDGATLSCFSWIRSEITRLQLAIQDPSLEEERALASIVEKLSMGNLMELLKLSDSMDAAVVFEETIKELWKVHPNPDLRQKLDTGIAQLLHGNKEKALITFNQLVGDDPTYAEAWNKVSTCQFMLGNMQSAMEATERTLVLEPLHFQAMNGLGLIQYETRRYQLALDSFRNSLRIDPWSPVSSRLSMCLDNIFDDGSGELEETVDEGSEEGTAPYEIKP